MSKTPTGETRAELRTTGLTEEIYCGRVVGVFMTPSGACGVAYRVSSRSFPNRKAVAQPGGASISPVDPHEARQNPYIAYRCLCTDREVAVASNGSHTGAIFERLAAGTPARDAVALGLLAFDYEHDSLNTPRIVAAVRRGAAEGVLGIIRKDGLQVETVELAPGTVHIVATYGLDRIGDPRQTAAFPVEGADAVVASLFDAPPFVHLLKPVCGACAVAAADGFTIAVGQASR